MPSTPVAPSAAPGVQVLLDAEREASRQIQQARQHRVQRLKDARAEAQTEIEALKRAKQEEYEAFERSLLGGLDECVKEYARETEASLEEVKAVAGEKSPEMVKLLLETVNRVEPCPHPNTLIRQPASPPSQ